MNHILIIEDEDDLRELIAYNLKKSGYVCTGVSNANDALIVLEDTQVNLITLDLMLPGLKGAHFLDIIRRHEKTRHIPVIIISALNTENYIVNTLEQGADDFITKPFSFAVLKAKIQTLLKRSETHAPAPAADGLHIDGEAHKVVLDGEEIKLTQKEYALLQILSSHPKRVFTRNQLLNSIWGYDSQSLSRTVDTHIASLRRKLGKKCAWIRSVPKIGYGWEAE